MSKLASSPGQSDLASFVASGDTSVPGIEMSDLNDGDILSRTRENVNPNGQFQFVYVPEDGTDPITSDWISQEHKKKVLGSWVEGVKSAIIGRSQAGLREANERAAEEKLKRLQQEQMDGTEKDDMAAPASRVVRQERSKAVAPAVGSPAEDPSEYVTDQLDQARERLRVAEEMQNEVLREVIAARKVLAKWQALASVLDGNKSVGNLSDVPDGPVHSNIIATSNTGIGRSHIVKRKGA